MSTSVCESVEMNAETSCFVARDGSFTKTIEQFGSQCFIFPCGFDTCSIRLSLLRSTTTTTKTSSDSDSFRLEDLLVGHCFLKKKDEEDEQRAEGRIRLGDGCSHSDLILEKCLKTMTKGEQSVLLFHHHISLGLLTTQVTMRVSLDDFFSKEGTEEEEEKEYEEWKMSSDKLRIEAIRLKEKGVCLYSSNDYRSAFALFSRATKLLIAARRDEKDEDDGDQSSIIASCYSNMAACQLLGKKYEHVVTNCNRALECSFRLEVGDKMKVKVLYRRAVAYTALKQYELATVDLNVVLNAEPRNTAALRQRKVVADESAMITNSLRVAMKKMFN